MQGRLLATSKMVIESTIEVFGRKIKPLPKEPVFTDYYHPSESQKKGEMAFIILGTGLVSYIAYRYL